MELLKELLQIDEAKAVRAWDGKLKRIDSLMMWMYDKNILTAGEKAKKDTIFNQYYRYYNDGDLPRALANKGFSKYDMKNNKQKIETALEEYIEDFIKNILKKYLPRVDRAEFRIDDAISNLLTVRDVAKRNDVHALLTYWLHKVKIEDEDGVLAEYVKELQKKYDELVVIVNKVDSKSANYTMSYRKREMEANGTWKPAMETKYKEIEELTSKISEFIGDVISSLKKLKKEF